MELEMTEQTDDMEEMLSPIDELALLKERAKMMGIGISGNIGVDALKKKIENHINGSKNQEDYDEEKEVAAAKAKKKSKAEIEQEIREKLWAEEMALVRCKIYNLNPSKRDLYGEIVTVSNRYLGTVKKFIPFGEATDNGYHIPKVLYNDLKTRQFQSINTKTVGGKIEVKTRMVPEYSIEVMPPLTAEELQELALAQEAAERVGME
jgi:hypothetical protein